MGNSSLVCFIFGLIFVGVAWFGMKENAYWVSHGVPVNATIVDKYVKEECQYGGNNSTQSCLDNFYIIYTYKTHEGVAYKGEDSINKTYWDTREIGGDVPLLYSFIQPALSSIAFALYFESNKPLLLLMLGFGCMLILISIILALILFSRHRTITFTKNQEP